MVDTHVSWTNDTQLVEGLILHIQTMAQTQRAKDSRILQKIQEWQDECTAIVSSLSDGVDLIFRRRCEPIEPAPRSPSFHHPPPTPLPEPNPPPSP